MLKMKSRINKKPAADGRAGRAGAAAKQEADFEKIVGLIESSQTRVAQAVNTAIIDLYWNVGNYLVRKIRSDGWGKRTVQELSAFIQRRHPGLRGFSPQNLWRMRQFVETYRTARKLSTVLRELPWSAHLLILGRSRCGEERELYLRLAIRNRWTVRELARQIDAGLFERAVLNPPKLSTALRVLHPKAAEYFKDVYSLEFLGLMDSHSESDLHGALLRNLGRFLTELGRDFCFVGSEYPLQVGGQDFALDLLFFKSAA